MWQPLAADLALALGEMSVIRGETAKAAWCDGTPPLPEFMANFWEEKALETSELDHDVTKNGCPTARQNGPCVILGAYHISDLFQLQILSGSRGW